MTQPDPTAYSDAHIRSILERVKTIAMVGASSNWNRPSYFVMKYLQGKGYRVIPVNPGIAGQLLLGETVYASLRDIPPDLAEQIDMVDRFRPSDNAPKIVEDAIAIGAPLVWMQLGIRNDAAAATAAAAGIEVILNRCPKIEFGRQRLDRHFFPPFGLPLRVRGRIDRLPKPRNEAASIERERLA